MKKRVHKALEKERRRAEKAGKQQTWVQDTLVTVANAGAGVSGGVATASGVQGWGVPAAALSGTALFLHFAAKFAQRRHDRDGRQKAARAMLLFLASGNAFTSDSHGQVVPQHKPLYRFTAFWPLQIDGEELLCPILRSSLGSRQVQTADSCVTFTRGNAFAGRAWGATEDDVVSYDQFEAIDDIAGTDKEKLIAWESQWRKQDVDADIVSKMGDGSREDSFKYIRHVRSIACFWVKIRGLDLVISIDSLLKSAFDPRFLGGATLRQLILTAGYIAREASS